MAVYCSRSTENTTNIVFVKRYFGINKNICDTFKLIKMKLRKTAYFTIRSKELVVEFSVTLPSGFNPKKINYLELKLRKTDYFTIRSREVVVFCYASIDV